MNITITNVGPVPLPYASSKGDGFALTLDPGVPVTTNDEDITVASVGDNPTFREELEEAAKGLLTALVRIITFWRSNHVDSDTPAVVHVEIANHGPNALRVILGDNTNDVEVGPDAIYKAEAPEYVEIRELGV